MLKLVDEDGDRVEFVVLCVHGGLWRSDCGGAYSRLEAVQGACSKSGASKETRNVRCGFRPCKA